MALEAPPMSDENVKKTDRRGFRVPAREVSYNDRAQRADSRGLAGRAAAEGGERRLGVAGRAARRRLPDEHRRQAHAHRRRIEVGARRSAARTSRGAWCSSCDAAFTRCSVKSSPITAKLRRVRETHPTLGRQLHCRPPRWQYMPRPEAHPKTTVVRYDPTHLRNLSC